MPPVQHLVCIFYAITSFACNPTYAPPVRSTHMGAPGRLQPGMTGLADGVGLYLNNGPTLSVGLGDAPVHLELGGDFARSAWAMGSIGVRYTLSDRERLNDGWFGAGPSFDAELGVGAGVGGERGTSQPGTAPSGAEPVDWDERRAYGGYGGVGFGWHVCRWFSPWMRTRAQLTTAEQVPHTVWLSGMAGGELDFGPVAIYTGIGGAGYLNRIDEEGGLLFEGGLSIHLGPFDDASPYAAARKWSAITAP